MYASVFSAFLNILLNWILIPRYGYFAAAYTTLFCYLLQAVLDYFAMKKIVKNRIYNIRYIVYLSLSVIIVSFISKLLYDTLLIRYAIIIVILLILFLYRKSIAKMRISIQN